MQFAHNIIFIFYPFFDPLKNIETYYVHCLSVNPLVAVVIHSESGSSATPTLPCHQSLLGACLQTLRTVHLNIVSTYGNDISSTIKLKQYVFLIRNISVTVVDYVVDIF